MKNNYVCAIDLGSSKIAAGLACFSKQGKILDLFLESVPSAGIKKGNILDSVDLSEALGKLLESIKAKSGINIKSISINIYGQDIITKHSLATIPLAERGNKIVTKRDIERLIEEAKILGSNLEEEIIHQIPLTFKVDDQESIDNPLGLYGHKLEVDLYLICAKSSYIQNINRLINNIGYNIKYFFLSGVATSKVVFSRDSLKKGSNIFCDIGSDITQIYLFKDNILCDTKILPLGGDDLTNGLSRELKIPFELAEDIKKSYASIGEDLSLEDKEVMIKKDAYYKPVSRRTICEITASKAKSLVQSINDSIKEIIKDADSLDSMVVAGRTILVDGLLEMMEAKLEFPVKMVRFSNPDIFDAVKDKTIKTTAQFLNYAATLGILYEGIELTKRTDFFAAPSYFNHVLKIINRAKEVYQEYF